MRFLQVGKWGHYNKKNQVYFTYTLNWQDRKGQTFVKRISRETGEALIKSGMNVEG
jgi:hypothetical protein